MMLCSVVIFIKLNIRVNTVMIDDYVPVVNFKFLHVLAVTACEVPRAVFLFFIFFYLVVQ